MTTEEIKNLVNCGIGANIGAGGKGCESILEATTSLGIMPRGFKFDNTQDITTNSDYIKQLQAENKLIILEGVKEFTTNKEDNVTETDGDGTINVTRRGLYAFNAMFKKGFNYQSALASISSFGIYDIFFIDSKGNILGTVSEDGSFKGFTAGMIEADGLNFATFSTRMSQGLTFQFLFREEVDTDYFFISGKELSWNPQRLDDVNEVVLKFNATPASAGTTIEIKATLRQGGSAVTGLAFGDFLLKVDGATANPTAESETSDGIYSLTVAALTADEVLAISLYDNANNRIAITDLNGDLFKSNTATATVV